MAWFYIKKLFSFGALQLKRKIMKICVFFLARLNEWKRIKITYQALKFVKNLGKDYGKTSIENSSFQCV